MICLYCSRRACSAAWNYMRYRKHIRLPNYDYSQNGYYFVTICAKDRYDLFSGIIELIIEQKINQIPTYYPTVSIDYFVVMKSHIHAIIVINNNCSRGGVTPPLQYKPTLGHVVAYFKYKTTKFINALYHTPGIPIWQRGYYEHVIRNETALNKIREYIANNPEKEKYEWDKLDVKP